MRTIITSATPAGTEQRGHRGHSFGATLLALFIALAAITATVIVIWQGSPKHRLPTISRIVGPGTHVGSVYHEQVPKAPNAARADTVSDQAIHQQEPPYLPMEGMVTDFRFPEQIPPHLPVTDSETDVRGLDDDSAALTAIAQRAPK